MNLDFRNVLSKAVLLAGIAGTASADTVYNLVTGFSNGSNPNGVWTYDYSSNSTGSGGTAFSFTSVFNTQPAWVSTSAGIAQTSISIVANTSGGTLNANSIGSLPNNTLNLNPLLSNVEVIFTAPSAGSYTIAGTFLDDDISSESHAVDLFDNGTNVFSGTISASQTSAAFNVTETLSTGGTIVFFVTAPSVNGTGDSNTGLTATVTLSSSAQAPEPGAMALLGAGLAGLAALRFSKRRYTRSSNRPL